LIICDEFHNLMKTSNDNRVRLLANNKKMSMMRAVRASSTCSSLG